MEGADENNALKDTTFTFLLKDGETTIDTATVKGEGTTFFENKIEVGLLKERVLTISEQSTNSENVIDDDSEYTWTLSANKADGVWTVKSDVTKSGESADVVFTNKYVNNGSGSNSGTDSDGSKTDSNSNSDNGPKTGDYLWNYSWLLLLLGAAGAIASIRFRIGMKRKER